MVELITTAKANDLHARRLTRRLLNNEDLGEAPLRRDHARRFKTRPGGYTRITKIGFLLRRRRTARQAGVRRRVGVAQPSPRAAV